MTIWHILYSFGTFFSGFGIMYQEKSGSPGLDSRGSIHVFVFFDGEKMSNRLSAIPR
jgi:hypothetical protein